MKKAPRRPSAPPGSASFSDEDREELKASISKLTAMEGNSGASSVPAGIQNTYSSRVVVRGTPSGKVYVFEPGQVMDESKIASDADADYLLSLLYERGCCGNLPVVLHYFIRVGG